LLRFQLLSIVCEEGGKIDEVLTMQAQPHLWLLKVRGHKAQQHAIIDRGHVRFGRLKIENVDRRGHRHRPTVGAPGDNPTSPLAGATVVGLIWSAPLMMKKPVIAVLTSSPSKTFSSW